jgi:hypothetical protein
MAIIIPSKNIYSIKNSPIIKNEIRKIEYNAANVAVNTEENSAVYNATISDYNEITNYRAKDMATKRYSRPTGLGSPTHLYSAAIAYAKFDNFLKIDKEIVVNRNVKDNKYILQLNEYEESEDGTSKAPISYAIYGKKTIGLATAKWQIDLNASDLGIVESEISYLSPMEESKTAEIITLPSKIVAEYVDESSNEKPKIELTFEKSDNVYYLETNKSFYRLRIEIPIGIRTTTLSGYVAQSLTSSPTEINLKGFYETYEPSRVELSIYGNVISLNLSEEVLSVGESNRKTDFSIGENELLQTDNLYQDENALTKFANDTIHQYQNGKETITLLCSISDYFDDTNDVAISITDLSKPMLFSIGDIIEPYKIDEYGAETALIENYDNTSKQFKIIGVKKIFDGACWQELICQEIV